MPLTVAELRSDQSSEESAPDAGLAPYLSELERGWAAERFQQQLGAYALELRLPVDSTLADVHQKHQRLLDEWIAEGAAASARNDEARARSYVAQATASGPQTEDIAPASSTVRGPATMAITAEVTGPTVQHRVRWMVDEALGATIELGFRVLVPALAGCFALKNLLRNGMRHRPELTAPGIHPSPQHNPRTHRDRAWEEVDRTLRSLEAA